MAKRDYTSLTLKRLYGKSGNCCAYPKCQVELIYETGNLSDICHIEALNAEGPRYNSSPDITAQDRNSEPNLILLCKNHHHIIDQKDEDGSPYYSTVQLKAMKQRHEELFAQSRQQLFNSKRQSILAQIVRSLSSFRHQGPTPKWPLSFEIETKLHFNQVDRYYGIIEKFAPYSPLLDQLYDVLDSAQFEDVLSCINNIYLLSKRRNESADETLDRTQEALLGKLSGEGIFEYSEELEICSLIVIVDAFMRCKILDEPSP
jgi:hypothetical protein